MKKIVLSIVMVALVASVSLMAQDLKKTAAPVKAKVEEKAQAKPETKGVKDAKKETKDTKKEVKKAATTAEKKVAPKK